MIRLYFFVVGILLLSGSLMLTGCQNSDNSSDQSAHPEIPMDDIGEDSTNVVDEYIDLSTGGEHESANYQLQLNVGGTATDGTQQRTSQSYHLTIGISAAQAELGEQ